MHDMLEGVIPYELCMLFHYLIHENLISEFDLVFRIDHFVMVIAYIKNHPANIKLTDSNDLGLKASQT